MTTASHPSRDELRMLINDELDEERRHGIEQHISLCDECTAEIARLTVHAESDAKLIEDLAAAVAPDPQTCEAHCRFEIVRRIGRGGMGDVFRARDSELKRDLAVKVLLPEHRHKPDIYKRFVEEAQLGAQLQHPGIVPVFEVGKIGELDNERPFFTMKLIQGRTLEQVLEERHDLNADLPSLLGTFLQICQTIAYAHSRGVIHRDLKPANVMVGDYGEVKVMDWGLAKVLSSSGETGESSEEYQGLQTIRTHHGHSTVDSDDVTRTGRVLGTLRYMPPEQANGDVARQDRRTDVFSLGAVLYEFITGTPPYSGDPQSVWRAARKANLQDAHTRLDSSGADLELIEIVRRCLAPAPEDRLPDAQAVALAVSKYQADVRERLRRARLKQAAAEARAASERWARKLTLALAAVVLFSATVGGLAWGGISFFRAQQRAVAMAALTEFESHMAEDRIWDASASLEGAKGHSAGAGGRQLRQELAEAEKDLNMAQVIEEIRLQKGEIREEAWDMTDARERYLSAFSSFGIDPTSLTASEAASRIRGRTIKIQLVAALDDWISATSGDGPSPGLREIVQLVDDDSWRRELRAAVAQNDSTTLERLAANVDLTKQTPGSLVILGNALSKAGNRTEAIDLLREAQRVYPDDFWINLQLAYELFEDDPPKPGEAVSFYRTALALRSDSPAVVYSLAVALSKQGDYSEAASTCRKAIELKSDYFRAYFALGNALHHQHRYTEAEQALRKAIDLDTTSAEAYVNLGNTLHKLARLAEAENSYQTAAELQQDMPEPWLNLGTILVEQQRRDEAEAAFRRAIELRAEYANAHFQLGNLFYEQKRSDEAAAAYRAAIDAQPAYFEAFNGLGNALTDLRQLPEAESAYREATRLQPNDADLWFNLGSALAMQEKFQDAERTFARAIELNPEDVDALERRAIVLAGVDNNVEFEQLHRRIMQVAPTYPYAYYNLANVYRDQDRLTDAEALYRTAIKLKPDFAQALNNLGLVLSDQEEWEEAEQAFRDSIKHDPNLPQPHLNLSNLLNRRQRWSEAEALARRAIQLTPDDYKPHKSLAKALLGLGRAGEAEQTYREARRLFPEDADVHFNIGNLLHDRGRLGEAEAAFRVATFLRPDFARAQTNLGIVWRDLGRPDEAEAAFRRAILIEPELFEVHGNLAGVLSIKDRHVEAEAAARKAVELAPEASWKVRLTLSEVLRRAGKLEEAEQECRSIVQSAPQHSQPYLSLAAGLQSQGRYADAESVYRQAIERHPRNALLHDNLGVTLDQQRRLEEALVHFRRATELDDRLADAHKHLGMVSHRLGKLEQASIALRRAITLNPNDAETHQTLGLVLRGYKLYTEAESEYRRAIGLRVDYWLPHHNLGVLLMFNLGRLEEAKNEFRETIKLKPDHVEAYINLSSALLRQGRFEEAEQVCRQAISARPDSEMPLINLAVALQALGRLDEAQQACHEAIKLEAQRVEPYTIRAQIHAARGELDASEEAYRQALDVNPRYANAHYSLGKLFGQQQRWHESQEAFQQAISCDPGLAEAYYELGKVLSTLNRLPEAAQAYQYAIARRSDFAAAYFALGAAFDNQGNRGGAEEAFRLAIQHKPNWAEAHCNLGRLLMLQGRFAEAVPLLKRGHELGSPGPGWSLPSADWLKTAEQGLANTEKLQRVLEGKQRPADADQRVTFADTCYLQRRFLTAAQFYVDAFDENPELEKALRFPAARAAAQAAGGMGSDSDQRHDAGRTRWRKQALAWFTAELDQWKQLAGGGDPAAVARALAEMQKWQDSPALDAVRAQSALAMLSPDEESAWRQFWNDVGHLEMTARRQTAPTVEKDDSR